MNMTHFDTRSIFLLLVLPATLLLMSCSPELSPLYRDYLDEKDADDIQVTREIQKALGSVGWVFDEPLTETVLRTKARTFQRWGLYKIEVYLDVAPMEGKVVRVLFHPYRIYFTGGRSKIPYLSPRLRRSVLNEINEALKDIGLTAVGTPVKRDRESTGQK